MNDRYTTDTFFNGRIQVMQPRSGYRYSLDTVLLAHYVSPQQKDVVLDLGTGCGIIPLILAYRHPEIHISGIEIQEDLADIALENVKKNHMESRIRILCSDMKSLSVDMTQGPVDLIVSNPPYKKSKSGRINPNHMRAIARHEITITLDDVMETAHRILRFSGRIFFVYPADRMTDILTRMRKNHIEPKSLRMIHTNRKKKAKRILLQGVKGGKPGITIAPPLIVYRDNGEFSKEVAEMFLP